MDNIFQNKDFNVRKNITIIKSFFEALEDMSHPEDFWYGYDLLTTRSFFMAFVLRS